MPERYRRRLEGSTVIRRDTKGDAIAGRPLVREENPKLHEPHPRQAMADVDLDSSRPEN